MARFLSIQFFGTLSVEYRLPSLTSYSTQFKSLGGQLWRFWFCRKPKVSGSRLVLDHITNWSFDFKVYQERTFSQAAFCLFPNGLISRGRSHLSSKVSRYWRNHGCLFTY